MVTLHEGKEHLLSLGGWAVQIFSQVIYKRQLYVHLSPVTLGDQKRFVLWLTFPHIACYFQKKRAKTMLQTNLRPCLGGEFELNKLSSWHQ